MLGYPKNENENIPSIHHAAQAGDISNVARLLDAGVDVNERNETKNTPLHIAALYGHLDIVAFLWQKNANFSSVNALNYTALHYAACWGHTEIVEFLLSKGADIEALSKKKRTPLHLSAFAGNTATIESLLASGANIEAQDDKNETPLGIAVAQNQIQIMTLLISKGANIEALNSEHQTPLQIAVSRRKTEAAELLLGNKANIHVQDENGNTLLHFSSLFEKNTEMISVLLKAGADINMENKAKQTPLHSAIFFGDAENVAFLIENGANVNAIVESETTPLHIASYLGHTDIVRLLLKHKATPSVKDCKGNTPLHIAAIMGYEHIATLLIQNGANPAVRNKKGCTSHYLAKMHKHSNIAVSNEKKLHLNLRKDSYDISPSQIYETIVYLCFLIAKECSKEVTSIEIKGDSVVLTAKNIASARFCAEFFAVLLNLGNKTYKPMPLRFTISSVKKIIGCDLNSKFKESSTIVNRHVELFSFFPDFIQTCFLSSAIQDEYVIYSYVMDGTRINDAVQKFNQALGAFGVFAFCNKTLLKLKFSRENFNTDRFLELKKAIMNIRWQASACVSISPVCSTSFRKATIDEEERAAELTRREHERERIKERKKEESLQQLFSECRLKTQSEMDSFSDWSEMEEALPTLPSSLDIPPRRDMEFKVSEPDERKGGIELIRDPIDDKGKEEVASSEKKKPKRQKMSLDELEKFVSTSSSSSSSVSEAPKGYTQAFQYYRERGPARGMHAGNMKGNNSNNKFN